MAHAENTPLSSITGLPFVKMHGSGNDFIVINQRQARLDSDHLSELTIALCRRRLSIGADGLISIEPSSDPDVDFVWRYINADGTNGDLCGNGAMCGARYAVATGLACTSCRFLTPAGPITASVDIDSGRVEMDFVDAEITDRNLPLVGSAGVDISGFHRLMIGVPHVVAATEDADTISGFVPLGRAIRHLPQLAPLGANVNIISRIDDTTIRMRTYERGVEDETLACGTGSVASAITAVEMGMAHQPVDVRVSSGSTLTVRWDQDGDRATNVRLAGHASVVATGTIEPDALL